MTIRLSWNQSSIISEGEQNRLSVDSYILEFDAVMRLAKTARADVTNFVVESGASLTDHKKRTPRTIILEGLVSNTPIKAPPPSGKSNKSTISAEVRKGEKGNTLQFSEQFDRVQDVYDTLQMLVREPILVTLETEQEVFERVTVTVVEDIRNAPHFAGASFTVQCQEIFIAETEEVEIPIPQEPRGQRRREESVSSTQAAEEQTTPPRSWALGIGQGLGILE